MHGKTGSIGDHLLLSTISLIAYDLPFSPADNINLFSLRFRAFSLRIIGLFFVAVENTLLELKVR